VLPWAITPLLMIGGAYLCYEGAEKLLEAFADTIDDVEETIEEEVAELTAADHEAQMVSGAIRTDFILSAEIMAIALKEVSDQTLYAQAAILALVAIAITVGVYGVVGIIVKMDDIGLNLAKRGAASVRGLGRGLVRAMPILLSALATIGTAAMIWVGGGIFIHGIEEFGFTTLPEFIHHLAEKSGDAVPFARSIIQWIVNAIGAGIIGLGVGGVLVLLHHSFVRFRRG
jgi:uncharacterized protein